MDKLKVYQKICQLPEFIRNFTYGCYVLSLTSWYFSSGPIIVGKYYEFEDFKNENFRIAYYSNSFQNIFRLWIHLLVFILDNASFG